MNEIIREILEEKRSALRGELGSAEVTIARHSFNLSQARNDASKLRLALEAIELELQRRDA